MKKIVIVLVFLQMCISFVLGNIDYHSNLISDTLLPSTGTWQGTLTDAYLITDDSVSVGNSDNKMYVSMELIDIDDQIIYGVFEYHTDEDPAPQLEYFAMIRQSSYSITWVGIASLWIDAGPFYFDLKYNPNSNTFNGFAVSNFFLDKNESNSMESREGSFSLTPTNDDIRMTTVPENTKLRLDTITYWQSSKTFNIKEKFANNDSVSIQAPDTYYAYEGGIRLETGVDIIPVGTVELDDRDQIHTYKLRNRFKRWVTIEIESPDGTTKSFKLEPRGDAFGFNLLAIFDPNQNPFSIMKSSDITIDIADGSVLQVFASDVRSFWFNDSPHKQEIKEQLQKENVTGQYKELFFTDFFGSLMEATESVVSQDADLLDLPEYTPYIQCLSRILFENEALSIDSSEALLDSPTEATIEFLESDQFRSSIESCLEVSIENASESAKNAIRKFSNTLVNQIDNRISSLTRGGDLVRLALLQFDVAGGIFDSARGQVYSKVVFGIPELGTNISPLEPTGGDTVTLTPSLPDDLDAFTTGAMSSGQWVIRSNGETIISEQLFDSYEYVVTLQGNSDSSKPLIETDFKYTYEVPALYGYGSLDFVISNSLSINSVKTDLDKFIEEKGLVVSPIVLFGETKNAKVTIENGQIVTDEITLDKQKTFDVNGNLIEDIQLRANSTDDYHYRKTKYEYSEQGNLITRLQFIDDYIFQRDEYSYDENGEEIKPLDSEDETHIYKYNENNQIIKTTQINSDGSIEKILKYKYNPQGIVIEEAEYSQEENLRNRYTYNNQGNLIEEEVFLHDNLKISHNKYDDFGNQIESLFYDTNDGTLESRYNNEYDKDGNLISELSYYAKDDRYIKWTYKYNEKNILIEESRYLEEIAPPNLCLILNDLKVGLAKFPELTRGTSTMSIYNGMVTFDKPMKDFYNTKGMNGYSSQRVLASHAKLHEEYEKIVSSFTLGSSIESFQEAYNIFQKESLSFIESMSCDYAGDDLLLNTKIIYSYDQYGNQIEAAWYDSAGGLSFISVIEYEYDKYFNWTKRTRVQHSNWLSGLEPRDEGYVTIRTIEYHE